jgi:hypothetical protein
LGPNEKITVIAIVKGGDIKGRIIIQSRKRDTHFERLARTDVNAKKKPSAVPHKPTRDPRRILLKAEISVYLLKSISLKPDKLKCPPSVKIIIKILISGKNTKSAMKIQMTTTLSNNAGSFTRFPNESIFFLLRLITGIPFSFLY